VNVKRYLQARADSYARDAARLRADGDLVMEVAYRTIADELRSVAESLPSSPAGVVGASGRV
jgi:hypothetical protein